MGGWQNKRKEGRTEGRKEERKEGKKERYGLVTDSVLNQEKNSKIIYGSRIKQSRAAHNRNQGVEQSLL